QSPPAPLSALTLLNFQSQRKFTVANVLPVEKQVMAISALAEGSSIRSIERMTGIHRDTIMRLGVRIGEACGRLMDETMRELPCQKIEVDEIWGYVGKKQRIVKEEDSPEVGDVWTFVAIDPDTKAVPSFLVGKRDYLSTRAFVADVSARMSNRINLSSDAMLHYEHAVEDSFGGEVDYGQIVKVYRTPETEGQRRYSPPEIESVRRVPIVGEPTHISTSIIERQNLTMRMHCRRLTRLTNAFSKKLDNFKAAVALHFAYYNFVKIHYSLRVTPAMALGISSRLWKVEDLVGLS
ncbi:MAG TPA: IS1 family transposase, partial [Opitutaceae bacterium]|nr:IS1 family transposase [Opitutaceae bacterium]